MPACNACTCFAITDITVAVNNYVYSQNLSGEITGLQKDVKKISYSNAV